MSTTEEELEVNLEAAAADDKDKDKSKETKVETVDTDKAINELKAQLAEEKSKREAAERLAQEASRAEVAAKTSDQDNQKSLIENAINALDAQKENLKQRYRALRTNPEGSDPDEEFEIQEKLAEISTKRSQLEVGKRALEQAPKPEARTAEDPVEAFAATRSSASAAWVRAHPEFVRDKDKFNMMAGAHNVAVGRGKKADTPEYFRAIEEILGIGGQQQRQTQEEDNTALSEAAETTKTKQKAPPSAPVVRGTNGSTRSVRLTAAQQEAAAACGMTNEEYAKEMVRLKDEGVIH